MFVSQTFLITVGMEIRTGSAPTQDERVDAVCTNGENDHGNIAACNTKRRACNEKPDSSDDLGDGNVPCALIEFSGRPRDSDGDSTGDKIGRACKDEGDSFAESEGLDNSGEEVLESIRCQVHVRHESKNPDHGIFSGLTETDPDTGVLALTDGVESHTVNSKIALFLCEPPSVVGKVRKEEVPDDSDDKGNNTLEDEEPLPATKTSNITKSVENTSCYQTSEGGGENVTSVENSNTSGNFLAVVKHREKVDSAGVIWCLSNTQEETGKQEALKVLGQGSESRDDSPEHHAATHIARRASSVEEHVGGDLTQEITDEENGHTGLVFCAAEVEILLKIVKAGECNGISVKVVEPVHGPQHGHDPTIELLYKSNFSRVGFLDAVSEDYSLLGQGSEQTS